MITIPMRWLTSWHHDVQVWPSLKIGSNLGSKSSHTQPGSGTRLLKYQGVFFIYILEVPIPSPDQIWRNKTTQNFHQTGSLSGQPIMKTNVKINFFYLFGLPRVYVDLSSECFRMHNLKGKLWKFSGGGPPDPPNDKWVALCFEFIVIQICKYARCAPPKILLGHLIHIGQTCSHCYICIVLLPVRDRSTHFQRIFQHPGLTPGMGHPMQNPCHTHTIPAGYRFHPSSVGLAWTNVDLTWVGLRSYCTAPACKTAWIRRRPTA